MESQPSNYERGDQCWDSAGLGVPSLTAQQPLLDGAEGKSAIICSKNKIRALAPSSLGKAVLDSLGAHAETPDAPPVASTCKRGGGSRSPATIGVGAISHASALEACKEDLAFTPRRLLGRRPLLGR
jgi:hypothetical protein